MNGGKRKFARYSYGLDKGKTFIGFYLIISNLIRLITKRGVFLGRGKIIDNWENYQKKLMKRAV